MNGTTLLAASVATQDALQDTVVMVVARDRLDVAADVMTVVLGAAFVLLLLGLSYAWFRLGRARNAMVETGQAVRRSVDPLLGNAERIGSNLEYVSDAVRTDVQHLRDSVNALSDRLHQASDRMEERIEEFNALMEVVQDEAEGLFVSTASTVRGVRAGARRLGDPDRDDGAAAHARVPRSGTGRTADGAELGPGARDAQVTRPPPGEPGGPAGPGDGGDPPDDARVYTTGDRDGDPADPGE